jgi:arylsulfatase A-like enzyme
MGETNHWQPELTADNHRISVPAAAHNRDSYHLTEDLVDQAISMVRDQKSVAPVKPFFMNLALGACHAPHQVHERYIEKYLDRFADGYDVVRQRRLERQIKMGVVPAGTTLTDRHRSVKPWADLDEDRRTTFVRLQAAYAGMLDHADEQLSRLVGFLESVGQMENTLVFVLSDNGASQEGSRQRRSEPGRHGPGRDRVPQ